MRVPFDPPSPQVWESYFRTHSVQYGGGGAAYFGGFRGKQFQRGHGLGSVLGSLFKSILPMAKTVGKTVGKEVLRTSAHVASDALAGQDIGEAFERRGRQSAAKLLNKGINRLEGTSPTTKNKVSVAGGKKKKKVQKGRGCGGRLGFMPRRGGIKGAKKQRKLIRRKVKVEDQLGSYYA